MRSYSCSKQFNRSMEEKPKHKEEEPHLSGAYIRSLVKQLSCSQSSSRKDVEDDLALQGLRKNGDHLSEAQQQQPQSQQRSPKSQPPKKQVRRRLHTTRPYQERLFNMAEARREIVAALKLHRASMKQANQQQQHQQQNLAPASALQLSAPPLQETTHELVDSTRNSISQLPNYTFDNYFHGTPLSPIMFPSLFSWNYPSVTQIPISDNINFALPDQPLGLNLNLQSFKNIDISCYINLHNQPPIESSPSQTSSSCSNSSPSVMPGMDVSAVSNSSQQASQVELDPASMPLHLAMDDAEMAEIHSIGEQHDMEWNDKMNLATSAWWSNFLKSMEGGLGESEGGIDGDRLHVFDDVLDVPSWLNDGVGGSAKEISPFQQDLDDYFQVEDYLQDTALASLDTREIEYQMENGYHSEMDDFGKGDFINTPIK